MAAAPNGTLFCEPRNKPTSPTGTFQPGCYRNFFLTGTTTYANVYADGALSTPLPQPVIAASDGRFPAIYMDTNITYRCQLYNAVNVIQEDVDPYVPPGQVNKFTVPITVIPSVSADAITVTPFGPNDTGLTINSTSTAFRSVIQFEQQSVLGLLMGINKATGDIIAGSGANAVVLRAGTGELDFSINNGTNICAQFIQSGAGSANFKFNVQGKASTTLIDITPDRATASSVSVGGIAGVLSTTINWFKIGNILVVNLPPITGTSNSTSFSLGNLPAPMVQDLLDASTCAVPAFACQDAGSGLSNVYASLSSTGSPPNLTGKITFSTAGSSTGWTASGTKGFIINGTTLTFWIQTQ